MAKKNEQDAQNDVELCAGCGSEAPEGGFKMIGVVKEDDETYAVPVCDACWKDPAHRQVPLKAHFFAREQAVMAVDAAQRNILAQDPSSVIRRVK